MDPNEPARKNRETLLTSLVLLMVVGFFGLFLNFVSLGIFFYVFLAMGVIGAIGCFHYFVWGHSLAQEVAYEREVFLQKQKDELDELENPYAIQVQRERRRPIRPASTPPDDRIKP